MSIIESTTKYATTNLMRLNNTKSINSAPKRFHNDGIWHLTPK